MVILLLGLETTRTRSSSREDCGSLGRETFSTLVTMVTQWRGMTHLLVSDRHGEEEEEGGGRGESIHTQR